MAESSRRDRSVETSASEIKNSYHVSSISQESAEKPYYDSPPESDSGHVQNGFQNNDNDMRDMARLGKKQEFKRNFSLWSSIGFVAIYMATWEFILITLSVGFTNGGYAAMFWCFITTTLAYSTVVASLAEMASVSKANSVHRYARL